MCFDAEVATVTNLIKMLSRGCHILHFTGHGVTSAFQVLESEIGDSELVGISELAFESEIGEMLPLRLESLQKILKEFPATQLVFVSACSSQATGQIFVDAGVPHVVAIKLNSLVTPS